MGTDRLERSFEFENSTITKDNLEVVIEYIYNLFISRYSNPHTIQEDIEKVNDLNKRSYKSAEDFINEYTDNENFVYNIYSKINGHDNVIIENMHGKLSIYLCLKLLIEYDKDIEDTIKNNISYTPNDSNLFKQERNYTKDLSVNLILNLIDKYKIDNFIGYTYFDSGEPIELINREDFLKKITNVKYDYEINALRETTALDIKKDKKGFKVRLFTSKKDNLSIINDFDSVADISKNIDKRIFISHGHSKTWKTFKDHFESTYPDEFKFDYYEKKPKNSQYFYDIIIKKINNCVGSIIFLTPENTFIDTTKHARDSVIHELGLCQMKHGKENVVIVVLRNCQEPSNINGMHQIRTHNIALKYSEIYSNLRKIFE